MGAAIFTCGLIIVLQIGCLLSAVAEDHHIEDQSELAPVDILARQQAYLEEHLGPVPHAGVDDLGGPIDLPKFTVPPEVVAERVLAELERVTSIPPDQNYYAAVARKLDGSPEALAAADDIERIIVDLGQALLHHKQWTGEQMYRPRVVEDRYYVETWKILSQWWVKHQLSTMTVEEARALLLSNLQVNPELPLHPGIGELSAMIAPLLGAEQRTVIYEALQADSRRADIVDWYWLWSLPGLEPSQDELHELLEDDALDLHHLAIRGLIHRFPNDPRGVESIINDKPRLDYFPIGDLVMEYLRSDRSDAGKQSLFLSYVEQVKKVLKLDDVVLGNAHAPAGAYTLLIEQIPAIPESTYRLHPENVQRVRELNEAMYVKLSDVASRFGLQPPWEWFLRRSVDYRKMLDDIEASLNSALGEP